MLLLKMEQYFSPVTQQLLLLTISKNNNKPMLKHVQPHEIHFSTSIAARISVVKHSNKMKTLYALHVTTKNGTIFFASNTAAVVTDHIKKQQ
jgi:hypothetical protein